MPFVQPGRPAPWFAAPTHSNPQFAFSSLGGRFLLLTFLPQDEAAAAAICETIRENRGRFGIDQVMAFSVVRTAALHARQPEEIALRWFLDEDGALGRLYGAADEDGESPGGWLIIDPSLRVWSTGPLSQLDGAFQRIGLLPRPDDHAGTPIHAPVLIVPRILEPAICRQLIEIYEADGGSPSGVMQQVGGKTVGVLSDFKKRRDADITDEALKAALRQRLHARLLPEIEKAFQFKVTRMERYIVAAYDAKEGGYFRPHRDNTTTGTAHRQFACSINLNAEDFEGGDLRFPEFGTRTYRPPTGGAVIFSCSLLHEATPVTSGRRYAFLPFFYDDAAAEVRQANLATIVPKAAVAEEA
ncbi:MAG: 2OG-Fe(II) oxygenase [Phenylobacterium sp.]|uniref:2OG-Fe(II) oxygenase n=1 Tax=Phenylobacterium sp. TaxID=1871053 RepID=UPI0027336D5F|nr:2OG-Fe(II) oxygenase [Phenylobacterium sp.]MDP3746262.1 2OG-Fe(II) oxygenase [Phenylobacterium sp.]